MRWALAPVVVVTLEEMLVTLGVMLEVTLEELLEVMLAGTSGVTLNVLGAVEMGERRRTSEDIGCRSIAECGELPQRKSLHT